MIKVLFFQTIPFSFLTQRERTKNNLRLEVKVCIPARLEKVQVGVQQPLILGLTIYSEGLIAHTVHRAEKMNAKGRCCLE